MIKDRVFREIYLLGILELRRTGQTAMVEVVSFLFPFTVGGLAMRRRKKARRRGKAPRLKGPRHSLAERVEKVGADKFGILAVDCAKARFQVMLANFYGRVLMEPIEVDNTAPALDALVARVRREAEIHGLEDLVVGLERTGRYHRPIRNVLQRHWTVKMVHPLATKHLRTPADPGNKTDATDLLAILRAIIAGYGTQDQQLSPAWACWRNVSRAREEMVSIRAFLRVRIQERIEELMPGYAALFGDLWRVPGAQFLAQRYGSASALVDAGPEALTDVLRGGGLRMQRTTVARILAWAHNATPPDPGAEVLRELLADQLEFMHKAEAKIVDYEGKLALYVADTPFVLLLGICGINAVSAASYGAELGPIEHYADSRKINGRAGLYPSRYQSDETDLADGPMVGHRNARLRAALLEIAHNLLRHNPHFKGWAAIQKAKGREPKEIHVALANRFARISYNMLAGKMAYSHPSDSGRQAVLAKLTCFALEHNMGPEATRELLGRALRQIPPETRQEEARAIDALRPRRRPRRDSRWARGAGPELLRNILPAVLDDLTAGRPIEPERSRPKPKRDTGRTSD